MHLMGILLVAGLAFEAFLGFIGIGKVWKRTYGNHWRNHTTGLECSRSFRHHVNNAKQTIKEADQHSFMKALWTNPEILPHMASQMPDDDFKSRMLKKSIPYIYAFKKFWS